MKKDTISIFNQGLTLVVALLILVLIFPSTSRAGLTSLLGQETQAYSDMPFPNIIASNPTYDATSNIFSLSSFATELELGDTFFNDGVHYGSTGTIGGSFAANMIIADLEIDESGNVVDPGTVTVTLTFSAAGSVADDYGVSVPSVLLEGSITEVLITPGGGGNVLDMLFDITGGVLQSDTNSDLPGVVFAPSGLGVLHFVGSSIPADWNSDFNLTGGGATLNTFGTPEPGTLLLTMIGATFMAVGGRRRN